VKAEHEYEHRFAEYEAIVQTVKPRLTAY